MNQNRNNRNFYKNLYSLSRSLSISFFLSFRMINFPDLHIIEEQEQDA